MDKLIKTYVDIEEIQNNYDTYYSATFTYQYDVYFLGMHIKTKNVEYHVPFLFKSFNIAKNFCELNPEILEYYFSNKNYYNREVDYFTYKIIVNDKIFYIKWKEDSIIIRDRHDMEFHFKENPVVDSFVTNIILNDWMHTSRLKDVEFFNETPDLLNLVESINLKTNKKWHFELVENN